MPRFSSIYERAKHQRRLYNLQNLNPLFWYCPYDISTITITSGAVSGLRDKSKNGFNLSQSDSARRPTVTSAEGFSALLYDSTPNDMLGGTTSSAFFAKPQTYLYLASLSAYTTAYNTLFDSWISGYNGVAHFIKSNGKSAAYVGTVNYDGNGAATYSLNEVFLFACTHGSNGIQSWKNGVLDGSIVSEPTITVTAPSTFFFGAGPVFNRYTPWTMREAICIPSNSTRQRQIAEGAILWRVGLQKLLSASHPFRNRPPLIGD